jgi:hypothetical protein
MGPPIRRSPAATETATAETPAAESSTSKTTTAAKTAEATKASAIGLTQSRIQFIPPGARLKIVIHIVLETAVCPTAGILRIMPTSFTVLLPTSSFGPAIDVAVSAGVDVSLRTPDRRAAAFAMHGLDRSAPRGLDGTGTAALTGDVRRFRPLITATRDTMSP